MTDKISALQQKIEKNPSQVFHRYSLAMAYLDCEDFKSACRELEICLEHNPNWMMAALFLGKTYMELAETEKAKENLEKAIQLAKEQNHDDPAEEATQLLKECNLKE